MIKFFKKKVNEKGKSSPNLLEIVTSGVVLTTELTRIAAINEKGGEIHGWCTVEHGKWHNDPLGTEINPVTGEKGFYTFEFLAKDKHNLLTNGGRDFFHNQVYTNTSAGTRGSGFIAVSSDTGGASDTHTSLAGEITTGGLGRADANTKSHTTGTNVTTIEHTFTASATHTAVQLSALFNAATGGTMTHENTFTPVTLQSGDTLKVTWTLTLG